MDVVKVQREALDKLDFLDCVFAELNASVSVGLGRFLGLILAFCLFGL